MAEKTLKDFGGDNEAFLKYLAEEEAKSALKSTPRKSGVFASPERVVVEGVLEVVSDKPINFKTSAGRFLEIGGKTVLISEALFQSNMNILKKGSHVKVECESRIKDVTGYPSVRGSEVLDTKHTSTGFGFTRLLSSDENAIQAATLRMKYAEAVKAKGNLADILMDKLNKAENPQAAAVMLAGFANLNS